MSDSYFGEMSDLIDEDEFGELDEFGEIAELND